MIFNDKNGLALKAKDDSQKREKLIRQSTQDILRIASKACNKYVSENDDEWSIALYAFSKAIDKYDKEKGDFMAFAAVLIKRDLIDYYRHEEHYSSEVLTSPGAFEGDADDSEIAIEYAVVKESVRAADNSLGEEIAALTECLKPFGFSFMDLTECSPKQERSRRECEKAIAILVNNKELFAKMMKTNKLPSSELTKLSGVSSKTLDKYRKYIIASAMILSDEYPALAWYLKPEERRQHS